MSIEEANAPFANGFRVIVARKGLKMNFVADQAGLTKQELSDMLNGRKIIKACDIPRMAKALGVGSDEVYAAGTALLP